MDVVNAGPLRTIEQRSHERLQRVLASPDHPVSADLTDGLAEVAHLTTTVPQPDAPVTRTLRDVVTQVQSYATALAPFPSACAGVMLQAMADVEILAQLGQKETFTSDDVRQAARATLSGARGRADNAPDPNVKMAIVSQALQDANRTLALAGDSASGQIVSYFLDKCGAQANPTSRAMVVQAGAKVLAGVLSMQPQMVARAKSGPVLPGAAFALPPEQGSQFNQLWGHFDKATVRVNRRYEGETFSVQEALSSLLRRGDLSKTDSNGNTLLSNLHQLLNQPMAPGIDRDLIVAQTIAHVNDPGRSMSQGTKMTCSAATVSYQLARRRPAEYVRLVCGLTWTGGQVQLASGTMARRVSGSLFDDGSGRSAVERLVQSALMQVGGTPKGNTTYDALTDGFFDERKQLVQTGMFPAEFAKLEEAVGEGRYTVIDKPSRETVLSAVVNGAEHVPVTMAWEGREEHWVLARGVKDGRVFFHNPHGHRATDRVTLSSGDHHLHDGGIESLPVDEFVRRTKAILLPT